MKSSEGSSMEQVRELLMGTQLKDMDQKFRRQEERLLREIAELRDSFKARLESLENFMKSENSSLLHRLQEEQAERNAVLKSEQKERAEAIQAEQKERAEAIKSEQRDRVEAIKNEQKERTEALGQLTKELNRAEESLERKLMALSGTLDTIERDLRQLLLSENSRLSDKVDGKYRDALGALSTTAAQIRHDMASRSMVSSLLTEMAVKISGQWNDDDSVLLELDETESTEIITKEKQEPSISDEA